MSDKRRRISEADQATIRRLYPTLGPRVAALLESPRSPKYVAKWASIHCVRVRPDVQRELRSAGYYRGREPRSDPTPLEIELRAKAVRSEWPGWRYSA
jgi:hypothetical protein